MAFGFPIALVLWVICLAAPAWADYQAGMDAYNGGDYATALREWRPLAEQGDPRAQFRLSSLYENGDGVQREFAKARQWYEKAGAQGEAMVRSTSASSLPTVKAAPLI